MCLCRICRRTRKLFEWDIKTAFAPGHSHSRTHASPRDRARPQIAGAFLYGSAEGRGFISRSYFQPRSGSSRGTASRACLCFYPPVHGGNNTGRLYDSALRQAAFHSPRDDVCHVPCLVNFLRVTANTVPRRDSGTKEITGPNWPLCNGRNSWIFRIILIDTTGTRHRQFWTVSVVHWISTHIFIAFYRSSSPR